MPGFLVLPTYAQIAHVIALCLQAPLIHFLTKGANSLSIGDFYTDVIGTLLDKNKFVLQVSQMYHIMSCIL